MSAVTIAVASRTPARWSPCRRRRESSTPVDRHWIGDKLCTERLDRLARDLRYQFKVRVQSEDCQFGYFGGSCNEKVGN